MREPAVSGGAVVLEHQTENYASHLAGRWPLHQRRIYLISKLAVQSSERYLSGAESKAVQCGTGLRAYGSMHRAVGSGAQSTGQWARGSEHRAQGSGAQGTGQGGTGHRAVGTGSEHRAQGIGYRGTGHRAQGSGAQGSGAQGSGHRAVAQGTGQILGRAALMQSMPRGANQNDKKFQTTVDKSRMDASNDVHTRGLYKPYKAP
eukprot:1159132-Pelagomonas_calceolata.AAC.4